MQTQLSVDLRYVQETKRSRNERACRREKLHLHMCECAQLLLLYLVIGFIVSDGSPDVINQRVDKILTLPHRSPAIRTGRAQISRKQNKTMRQPDMCGSVSIR